MLGLTSTQILGRPSRNIDEIPFGLIRQSNTPGSTHAFVIARAVMDFK
jgi:hypothetical protein